LSPTRRRLPEEEKEVKPEEDEVEPQKQLKEEPGEFDMEISDSSFDFGEEGDD